MIRSASADHGSSKASEGRARLLPESREATYEESPLRTLQQLHQTLGNRATQGLLRGATLQAKLRVGAAGDRYEREADRIAEHVMRSDNPQPIAPLGARAGQAQRMCSQCREEEDELVQPKLRPGAAPAAGSARSLAGLPSGHGTPLSDERRAYFEPRFGHDFSDVRVHAGTAAADASHSIGARAFTVGRNVFFGSGEYAPDTNSGRRLLAHELAHVVQQTPLIARRKPLAEAGGGLPGLRSTNDIDDEPEAVQAQLGRGRALSTSARTRMESAFGRSFSDVRVHNDPSAMRLSNRFNARAFTIGADIAFGPGEYRPGTLAGDAIIAHELAHVLQQNSRRRGEVRSHSGSEYQTLEDDADAAAAGAMIAVHARAGAMPTPEGDSMPRLRSGLRFQRCSRTARPRSASDLERATSSPGPSTVPQVVPSEPPPAPTLPVPTHQEVQGITTPQPVGVGANQQGQTSFEAGGVQVIFLPDRTSTAQDMQDRAETTFRIRTRPIQWQSQGGVIQSFTGPTPATVTIYTTYGPGVSATSSSGYGRGTTAEDVQEGNTSLGFHEGRHGLEFVDFLTNDPFPQFTGSVGMSQADFQQAMTDFAAAVRNYRQRMKNASTQSIDCVGTTVDQYNAQRGIVSTYCAIP